LYPGLKDTRDNRRSVPLKEVHEMIAGHRWAELATRFPNCRAFASYRATSPDWTSFRDASERFLAYQRTVNKAPTVIFYEAVLKRHIWSTAIAEKPLRLIGTTDIVTTTAPVRDRGHGAQAANVRRVLSAVFNWAMGERGCDGEYLASDNPVKRTRPIESDPDFESGINPFSASEQEQIVAAAREGWERRLVIVALETGLRPNETFGLKRVDIDLGGRVLHVRQTWSRYGEGTVKNRRSRRDVRMSDAAYRALREQLAETELRFTWLWPVSITHPAPHNPQNLSRRYWRALLERAGVSHREFYQCRHTFATNRLTEGCELQWIADQMGHKDLRMLINHYLRWKPGRVEKARKAF
jgi:integrase